MPEFSPSLCYETDGCGPFLQVSERTVSCSLVSALVRRQLSRGIGPLLFFTLCSFHRSNPRGLLVVKGPEQSSAHLTKGRDAPGSRHWSSQELLR